MSYFKIPHLFSKGNNKRPPLRQLDLSSDKIKENSDTDTDVSKLYAYDPYYPSEDLTITLPEGSYDNDEFYLSNTTSPPKLKVSSSASLDHEISSIKVLLFKIANPDNLYEKISKTIHVTDVNEKPTAINLSSTSIDQGPVIGRVVGEVTAEDPDEVDCITNAEVTNDAPFKITSIVDQSDGSDAWYLVTTEEIYYEGISFLVDITVYDKDGLSISGTKTISVNDVAMSTFLEDNEIEENTAIAPVGQITYYNPNGDNDRYLIDSSDSAVTMESQEVTDAFKITKKIDGYWYLEPYDVNLDHETKSTYWVDIKVNESRGFVLKERINVQVLDVNEPPTDIYLSNKKVGTNRSSGTTIGQITMEDPDSGDYISDATILSQEAPAFNISTNNGDYYLVTATTFSDSTTLGVEIQVTDSGGLTTSKTFDITILGLSLDSQEIKENTVSLIGKANTTNSVDSNDNIDSAKENKFSEFEMTESTYWYLTTTRELDRENKSTYEGVEIEATTIGGIKIFQTFTITVLDESDEPPTDITLSSSSVDISGKGAPGYFVGEFTEVSDPDLNEHFIMRLPTLSEYSNNYFKLEENDINNNIDNEYLILDSILNEGTYTIRVEVEDSGGNTYRKNFDINVTGVTVTIDDNNIDAGPAGRELGQVYYSGLSLSVSDVVAETTAFKIVYEVYEDRYNLYTDADVTVGDYLVPIKFILTDSNDNNYTLKADKTVHVLEPPTGIVIDSKEVMENSNNTEVGLLSLTNNVSGHEDYIVSATIDSQSVTDAFKITYDNRYYLTTNKELDHESNASIDVTITATNRDDIDTTETFTITVLDENEPPTNIYLSNYKINIAGGSFPYIVTSVEKYNIEDPEDSNESFMLSLPSGELDNDLFELHEEIGNNVAHESLYLSNAQHSGVYQIRLTVTDSVDNTYTEDFDIYVSALNFTSLNIDEGTTTGRQVGKVEYYDPDGYWPTNIYISSQEVDGAFSINLDGSNQGNPYYLENNIVLNYDEKKSYDIYEVVIEDSGGVLRYDKIDRTIQVNEINEQQIVLTTDLTLTDRTALNNYDNSYDPFDISSFEAFKTMSRMELFNTAVVNESDSDDSDGSTGNDSYIYKNVSWDNMDSTDKAYWPAVGSYTETDHNYNIATHAFFLIDTNGNSIYDYSSYTIQSVDQVKIYFNPNRPLELSNGTSCSTTSDNTTFKIYRSNRTDVNMGCFSSTTDSSSSGWIYTGESAFCDPGVNNGPDHGGDFFTKFNFTSDVIKLASISAPMDSTSLTFTSTEIDDQSSFDSLLNEWVKYYSFDTSDKVNCPIEGIMISANFGHYSYAIAIDKVELTITIE